MLHFKTVFCKDIGEHVFSTGKTETGNEYEVGKAPSGRFFCITVKPYAGRRAHLFDTIAQAFRFANFVEDMRRTA